MLIKFLLAAFLPNGILAFGKTVYVGGLFETDSLVDKAFRSSITLLNEERRENEELPNQFIQPRLIEIVDDDSYDLSGIVCDLGNSGVAALFGPQDEVNSRVVQSMCDTMEIPHVAARWDSEQMRGNGLVNLYPYSHAMSTVYLELAKAYKWKKFTIIYETTESLIRMNQLLKRWNPAGYTVTIRQLPEGPDYREVLREVKASGDLNIVLDCSIEILYEVLKQSLQVGILTDKHDYIIGTLDLQTINLEPFQYGGTNFTGLRLIDPEDPLVIDTFEREKYNWDLEDLTQLTVEAALIYDGVQLFGRALKQLDDAIVADVKTSLCDNRDSWEHGSSLSNFMRLTEFRGLTGLIKFDSSGYRSDFKLDLIGLDLRGVKKIGVWNSSTGIDFVPKRVTLDEGELSLRNKTFLVLISLAPPYGMLTESAEMKTGNDRYEGFCIDIIQELSKHLGFNYTFEDAGSAYGTKDKKTGEWNGMIRRIMENTADLAICDLTITADRQEAVDFTKPFMNLGISILFTKPLPAGASFFSFLTPFSVEVWMYVLGSYTAVSLLIFVVGRLCPEEWNNPYPCIEEPEELENQFTLKNSFWFTLGAIMQQGSEIAPIGLSPRMVGSLWSFFVLIMVSSYTANLAACLVIELPNVQIKTAADLVDNPFGIKYGAKNGGSTMDFFKGSSDPVYARMNEYMEKNKYEVLLDSNDDGVNKVLAGKYAFFMESSTIAYEAERKCKLQQVGSLLDFKGYGIAMKKESPYRGQLSTTILTLQETGVIRELETKWWTQKRGGGRCAEKKGTSDAEPLGTDNVGGVFVVLIGGIAIAGVMALWELIWNVGCTSIEENVSFKEEIKEEVKFIFKCSEVTKPVRRRKSCSQDSNESNEEESVRGVSPAYGFVMPTVITTTPEDK